jgi:hypothetical protein
MEFAANIDVIVDKHAFLARLLCARCERPSGPGGAEHTQKFAPPHFNPRAQEKAS